MVTLIPAVASSQESRQGRSGGGASSGGIELVDAPKETNLSRADAGIDVFVRERVSAGISLAEKAVPVIAKPGTKMLMLNSEGG